MPCGTAPEDLARLVETRIERFGHLDICVANAAANPAFGPLETLSDEAWDKVMDVNLRSVFRLAKLTGAHLAKSGDGTFIAISSIGAIGLFLAAPASRYVTGQTIIADGGAAILSALNPG